MSGLIKIHIWLFRLKLISIISFISVLILIFLCPFLPAKPKSDRKNSIRVIWIASSRILVKFWRFIFNMLLNCMISLSWTYFFIWCVFPFFPNFVGSGFHNLMNIFIHFNMRRVKWQYFTVVNSWRRKVINLIGRSVCSCEMSFWAEIIYKFDIFILIHIYRIWRNKKLFFPELVRFQCFV